MIGNSYNGVVGRLGSRYALCTGYHLALNGRVGPSAGARRALSLRRLLPGRHLGDCETTPLLLCEKRFAHGRAAGRRWLRMLCRRAVLLRHESKTATPRIAPLDAFSTSFPGQLPGVDDLSPDSHRGRARDGRPGLRNQHAFNRLHFRGPTLHYALSLAVLMPCGRMLRALRTALRELGKLISFHTEKLACVFIFQRFVMFSWPPF